jgi:hypothetical protein
MLLAAARKEKTRIEGRSQRGGSWFLEQRRLKVIVRRVRLSGLAQKIVDDCHYSLVLLLIQNHPDPVAKAPPDFWQIKFVHALATHIAGRAPVLGDWRTARLGQNMAP